MHALVESVLTSERSLRRCDKGRIDANSACFQLSCDPQRSSYVRSVYSSFNPCQPVNVRKNRFAILTSQTIRRVVGQLEDLVFSPESLYGDGRSKDLVCVDFACHIWIQKYSGRDLSTSTTSQQWKLWRVLLTNVPLSPFREPPVSTCTPSVLAPSRKLITRSNCFLSASGPKAVSSKDGSPIFCAAVSKAVLMASMNLGAMLSWTKTRLAA